MTEPDADKYQQEILRQMEAKDTDDLILIWIENDRDAWTDEAFAAVRVILLERMGELPEQGLPGKDEEDEIEEDKHLIVPFPQDKKLVWIAEASILLSKAALVVGAAYTLVILFSDLSVAIADIGFSTIFDILSALIVAAAGALTYGLTYLVLQAVAEIIYLLLDIRELSRLEPAEKGGTAE